MSLSKKVDKVKRETKSDGMSLGRKFVVQQHQATSEHWDLRIQNNGKMISFSVPKGPSMNPSQPRLAISMPPHSLDYGDFEGVIAEGLYGAGKVMQWDTGVCYIDGDFRESYKNGKIEFFLEGEKLRGGFALVKMDEDWLLVKKNDDYAIRDGEVVSEKIESVKSGKTIDAISERDGIIDDIGDIYGE